MTRIIASPCASSSAAHAGPVDPPFTAVGDGPLSDVAIDALAALLVDSVEGKAAVSDTRLIDQPATTGVVRK